MTEPDTARMLAEALVRVSPRQRARHPMLIGEALRSAGLDQVPADIKAFRRFVQTSIDRVARSLLGTVAADRVTSELLALTAAAAADPDDTLPLGAKIPQPRESEPRASIGSKKDVHTTLGYESDGPDRDK